jgi:dihydrofolate reductase
MRRLIVFNQVTLDGYFSGPNGDFSWAHRDGDDQEWNDFVAGNASGGGTLLFGRVTYELMASYWPTTIALQNNPMVAKRMNDGPKVVFSRTLDKASWSNTKLVKGDLVEEVRKMKQEPGDGIAILGSGSIVAQLAQARLIDEYQIVIIPTVLGRGRTMFEGIERIDLKLVRSRVFGNGNVLLCYEPEG